MKYKVLSPIKHQGKIRLIGEIVEISEDLARNLKVEAIEEPEVLAEPEEKSCQDCDLVLELKAAAEAANIFDAENNLDYEKFGATVEQIMLKYDIAPYKIIKQEDIEAHLKTLTRRDDVNAYGSTLQIDVTGCNNINKAKEMIMETLFQADTEI
jgi:hypothetical protein